MPPGPPAGGRPPISHELRRRVLVTLGLITVAEVLHWIPVPGVDARALSGLPRAFAGRISIGALGVGPYLTASVLAVLVFLARRDPGSRESSGQPFDTHAVWIAFPIALMQGLAHAVFLQNLGSGGGLPIVRSPGPVFVAGVTLSVAAGAMLTVALARLISRHGLGNGLCVLLGMELARGQLRRLLDGRGLSENAPALALLLGALLWLAVVWLSARWVAVEPSAADGPDRPGPWWLRANVAGVMGISLAESLLGLPAALSGYLTRGQSSPGWASALDSSHPAGAVAFVVLSVLATWLFTAWALDPARLVRLLPPAGEGDAETRFDEGRFERRALAATLGSIAGAPVAVLLFGLAARRLGAPGLSASALAVLAAVALDTSHQFRAHAAMARALEAPSGGRNCGVCGGRLAGGEAFCPACGAAFADAAACGAHPGVPALSRCVVCARPLCGECALERDGRSVCREHGGIAFVEGWAVAAVTETPLEAEGLRRRLAAAGLGGRVLVGTCSALRATLGLYDLTPVVPLAVHASCGGGQVRLLVPPSEHGRAAGLLATRAD